MRIGLLTIATGKYDRFINRLHGSAQTWFMKPTEHEVKSIVLTDSAIRPVLANYFPVGHLSWPGPTLFRYHMMLGIRDWLLENTDYLFYCDVDMEVVSPVGNEVLGDLVATIHPGFWYKSRYEYTYETRPQSLACVYPWEGKRYYAGGFQGGRTAKYLEVAEIVRSRIDADARNGITAVWHDESHWNRLLVATPPTIELDPGYCYPETTPVPFKPRLMALAKDHAALRSTE